MGIGKLLPVGADGLLYGDELLQMFLPLRKMSVTAVFLLN